MTTEQMNLYLVPSEVYRYDWHYILDRAEFVSFDTEGDGRDIFNDPEHRVYGFSLTIKHDGHYYSDYFPTGHRNGPNLTVQFWGPLLVKAMSKKVIMHNAIHDLRELELLYWDVRLWQTEFEPKPPAVFYDTMKLAHLENENMGKTGGGYSLDACTLRYLGYKGKVKSVEWQAMLDLVGWEGMTWENHREYASGDTEATYKLFEALQVKISKEPTTIEYWQKFEQDNLTVLKRMRTLGIKVDIDFANYMENKGLQRMREIEAETGYKFEGTGSRKAMEKLFWEDLKLPQIINKKTGSPTLDKEAFERYEILLERTENSTLARLVLEFRGWQKSVTSFYRPYQTLVGVDGRIRTNYKPHGTVTGRYSSSEPNLQQIPKESDRPWNGNVKKCFVPEEGYELWELDYSQLEFRLAALFSREPKLLEVFNTEGRDIFSEMSEELGFTRQQCKTLTYSIQYGAGAQRIMDVFGVTRGRALEIIGSWYSAYPGVLKASKRAELEVIRTGKLQLWSGRYRHFENKKYEARKAFNSANQGGGADIVKRVMNKIHNELPEVRMLLQIHDALVFELPIGSGYLPQIKEIMEKPLNTDIVRFKVDAHILGSH